MGDESHVMFQLGERLPGRQRRDVNTYTVMKKLCFSATYARPQVFCLACRGRVKELMFQDLNPPYRIDWTALGSALIVFLPIFWLALGY